jgi:hypothetical protein
MIDQTFDHPFRSQVSRILNSGQSNSVVLSGNVHDLFFLPGKTEDENGNYVSLTEYLSAKWGGRKDVMPIIYEPNRQIRFVNPEDKDRMRGAWIKSMTGVDANTLAIEQLLGVSVDKKKLSVGQEFDDLMSKAGERPATAISLLRLFCYISNKSKSEDLLHNCRVIIFIEWADMLVPEAELSRLSEIDRLRLSIFQDWFSDPAFIHGRDSVLLLTESIGLMNSRLTTLPQIMKVEVPAPDTTARKHFIEWFEMVKVSGLLPVESTKNTLADQTAALNLQTLSQLLKGALHDKAPITQKDVVARINTYIQSQLGEGTVEFKQPIHSMANVVGCRKQKALWENELHQRLISTSKDAITGIGVAGPIGGGKSFFWEAVAAALGIPVLVLKNIRSQWFGQTDVILEKLYRILISLPKVMILVDEADTVFGGVGPNVHDTERRLTGTIQGWMADPRLRGKVVWLLMSARIHLLSPDMRRPGRLGIIIPMPDPTGEDHDDFVELTLRPVTHLIPNREGKEWKKIQDAFKDYSAGAFQLVGSELEALMIRKKDATLDDVLQLIHDQLPADIETTRRYQLIQAYMNTTRRSLLPDPENANRDRYEWTRELRELEAQGITGY